MYIFEEMLEAARQNVGFEWKSGRHQRVAQNTLLCNPAITKMDDLMRLAQAINEAPEEDFQLSYGDFMVKYHIPFTG